MAEKNLGKIAMTFAGDWDANTSYERLVAVTHQGSSWVSTREVPAGIAPSSANATYWQKLAAKGEPTSVINDLTTGGVEAALSAEMGKNLNTKVAQLDQDWNALKEQIQDAVLKVEVAPHIEVVTIEGGAAILQPDKLYDFGEVANLAIGFEAPLEGKAANYAFQFKSPADAPTTITMPDSVVFPVESDSMFNVKAGRTYQVTILNGLAVATSWEV
jgi:hypothetical protein